MTPRGQRQFTSAAKRIYIAEIPRWDKHWRILITSLGKFTVEQRKMIRKELLWLGFSRLASGTYIHPTVQMKTVHKMLEDLQISKQVITLYASEDESTTHVNQLIMQFFARHTPSDSCQLFIKNFQPIAQAVAQEQEPDPKYSFFAHFAYQRLSCYFVARTYLIVHFITRRCNSLSSTSNHQATVPCLERTI